ncbi:MAG: structural protein P5 [Bacteroidaceae bacterium]|nr:structural protein P5 [Bacteroidaceae bacterium]
MSRGLRNCNPLNIRRVAGTTWKGEIPQSSSPSGGGREGSGFCQFETIEWGLRAAFVLLRTYSTKYRANCVRDIVSRWAPPTENNTEQYIKNVCFWTGFGGLQRLTESDWPALVRAMARQECGVLLDTETINRGYKLFKTNNYEK